MEMEDRLRPHNVRAARQLRQTQTSSEALLWAHLRGGRCMDTRFRRQHPIGRFVVDFYSPDHRLVIEIDGAVHGEPEQIRADFERQQFLEAHGYRFVRLSATLVTTDIERALQTIIAKIAALPPPSHVYTPHRTDRHHLDHIDPPLRSERNGEGLGVR